MVVIRNTLGRTNKTYYIVDSIMGSGKTTATFNYIREHPDKRYIYVTPYLTEVKRGLEELSGFSEPRTYGTKMNHLKSLLKHGRNVVTTHSLFERMDGECTDLIRRAGYTLILDETIGGFNERSYNEDVDIAVRAGVARVGEDGYLRWEKRDYNGEMCRELRAECEARKLVCWNGSYITVTSPKLFKCFQDAFVLTYMFAGQTLYYYFKVNGIPWEYSYVTQDYRLTSVPTTKPHPRYGELIHVLENDKLNNIGEKTTALSKHQFILHKQGLIDKLKNNIYTYAARRCKAKGKQVMWTCYKDWAKELTYAGYKKGFVPCNTKATNEYRDRTVLIYALNRYMNVSIKNYLNDNGADVDEDEFALSEMLQWIFRSAVRNGEEIWIYVPSRRMRSLLLSWIEEVDGSAA